jgi:hypothetical protein
MPEPKIAPKDRERIAKYLQLDEEHLYSVLASHAEELRGTVFDPAGQQKAGRRVFEKLEEGLRTRLCDEWGLCAKLETADLKDATNLVVLIGDVIAVHVGGLPPFLVASLLVKIGLRRFCRC